jgi:ribonuclease Z
MLRLTLLGTAAARPTVGRNPSGIALQRESELYLLDCGEGTQRQMMRYGTGFGVRTILVTHLHADHFLGITGLLRTMGLQGREEKLEIVGPPGSADVLQDTVRLGLDRVPFEVEVSEMAPGERRAEQGYDVEAIGVRHRITAIGYAFREHPRPGRFDVDRARAMGIPEGPLFGRLHRGESVEVEGRTIAPSDVVGSARPGRLVVYTGDTRPCRAIVDAARDADLLVHEATFSREESARSRDTFHSTAAEAATVARDAGARRLVLTHLSARYSDAPHVLEREARAIFPGAVAGYDGLSLEIPFLDSGAGKTP